MRKIICALITAGMALMLTACGEERSVKIENGAAVIAESGLKVTLPQGWVVFDTEESMNRYRTMVWGYYTDYIEFIDDTELGNEARPWKFLLYAERQGGGIALTMRVGELPEAMDVYDYARHVNNIVTESYKRDGLDAYATLEPIPNGESTGIQGYISEVSVKESESDDERMFVATKHIFTYKDDMYCMEIRAEESAYNDGKNIQILSAEL